MKIHSDSPLSKIEQLFNNLDSNLSKNQYIRLQFKLNGYKEKKLGQDQVIIETSLIDGQYSQTAILIGKAAELIKVYQNEKFINVNSMIIQLLQWKVAYLEKNKAYTIVIYEFQYIGSLDGEHECTQYNVEQNCQSQKKLRVTIKQHNTINNNTSHQQYITNSIKKVKIENSSFTKDSFIIDDNLLNISALDNPANNKQSNQFKDYQQQQQIQQSELTKISAMYPNMKKWVLEGRIILKSEQLDFRCKKTDTIQRYFKIIILDCEQEIIVGLFYEKALSKFFSVLQQGKVYTFKNGCIGQDKANGIVDLIYGYNLNYINGYNIQQPLNLFNFFCAFLNIFINCNSIPKSAKLKINCNNILILQIYIVF